MRASAPGPLHSRPVAHGYALYREALERIPGGTRLISRRPDMYAPDLTPPSMRRGQGSRCWDLDGNEYLDLMSSLHANWP
ncbi:hypothetical protein [Roseiflexus sp.]|uniref:hypothetical protein n=1 Tax=Roseiflexus sp. TaxID=2562120 RepID=UPI00398B89DE